jgi:hypothetical protein
MDYKFEAKVAPNRDKVMVLEATFEAGKPVSKDDGRWRQKLRNRAEQLKYLESGERYWYSQEWFGSEKRKQPA